MRPVAPPYPIPARSPLHGYESLAFDVRVAGDPSRGVRVLELSPYRAAVVAGIHLGVSADKLRVQRVPNVTIDEMRACLESAGVA